MIRRLLIAALLAGALLGHHDTARAQTAPQYVFCISVTSTLCNTVGNPGNGTQGDDAWLAFGKYNVSILALQPPTPQYGIVYANGNGYGDVLPGSTGIWCPQWSSLSAAPTLVACPGSAGSVSAINSIVGSGSSGSPLQLAGDVASPGNSMLYGTNSSGALGWYPQPTTASVNFSAVLAGTNANALVIGSGGSINPSGTGVVNGNEINGAVIPTSATIAATNSSKQIVASQLVLSGGNAVTITTTGTTNATFPQGSFNVGYLGIPNSTCNSTGCTASYTVQSTFPSDLGTKLPMNCGSVCTVTIPDHSTFATSSTEACFQVWALPGSATVTVAIAGGSSDTLTQVVTLSTGNRTQVAGVNAYYCRYSATAWETDGHGQG